jgi:hypothetical protein
MGIEHKMKHVDGRKQVADLLTKPIEHVRFEVLYREIGINLWGGMKLTCAMSIV